MSRELVGYIGVDSGNVMICDPGYANKDSGPANPENMIAQGKKEIENGNFERGSHWVKVGERNLKMKNIRENWKQFCADAEEAKNEPREYGLCVVSPTRYGDGEFPVYVTKDKEGRVKKMEVIF